LIPRGETKTNLVGALMREKVQGKKNWEREKKSGGYLAGSAAPYALLKSASRPGASGFSNRGRADYCLRKGRKRKAGMTNGKATSQCGITSSSNKVSIRA